MKTSLESDHYYHIYNRGNNGGKIFFEDENYYYFLKKYTQYISPFCDTLAFVLMPNHFHICVRVKNADEVDLDNLKYETVEKPKKIDVHLQFGHFFNAYAKAVNRKYNRTGSLFEKNFERKEITDNAYLTKVIHYIHRNPVVHQFAGQPQNYPWSSYRSIISSKPTKLNREFVISLFGDLENFKNCHQIDIDDTDIRSIL